MSHKDVLLSLFMDPLVGIVVLNFNGRDCLLSCLESLRRLRYQNAFVVVVDNASDDNSFFLAQKSFPEYSYIGNSSNKGFAAGMNIGMKVVFERGASFAWLVNNDARADEQALGLLVECALRNDRAGLLSPIIYNPDTGALWFGKGKMSFLRMRTIHVAPKKEELACSSYDSEILTGCALLVRRSVFVTVGSLDERFFLYYEDADFSLRAQKNGFQTLVVPAARVFHTEQSQRNSQKLYYLVLSGLLFFQKHAYSWKKPYFFVYGTIRRIKNAVDIMRRRDGALSVRRAYDDFYHGH